MLLLLCLTVAACSSNSNYDQYDKDGYNVTVKYDANGSYFKSAGQLFLSDSYNISGLKTNASGNKEILLVDPESSVRGDGNVHMIERTAVPGYSFVGWYTSREAVVDENGNVVKDDKNNVIYKYSGKWDFSKKLEIDPNKDYTASEPVITLYAGWVKNPSVEIYDENETLLGTYEIKNPTLGKNSVITAPYLDLKKGEYNFGTLKNAYSWQERYVSDSGDEVYTYFFDGLYLDKNMSEKMPQSYTHPFIFDAETAAISDSVLKLYVNYDEQKGDCYRIYSAAQLANNAKPSGNYEIMADIEFTALTPWPNAFRNNDFSGSIAGNGHKISGVNIESTAKGQYFGMFKSISKDAKIENVIFNGVTATIKNVYIKPGARYAVFAAIIEDGFKAQNVTFANAVMKIAASASAIVTEDYEVGFICADGYSDALGISLDGFTAEVETSEIDLNTLVITPNGNSLELVFTPKAQE